MALKNFFDINMPYGIRGNNKKGWFAFNREYKPLGFNKKDIVKYDDYPISTKYNGLFNNKIEALRGEGTTVYQEGIDTIVFLYDDLGNPMRNKKNWAIYMKKLELLSKLKIKK